jgi:hypothetical protein
MIVRDESYHLKRIDSYFKMFAKFGLQYRLEPSRVQQGFIPKKTEANILVRISVRNDEFNRKMKLIIVRQTKVRDQPHQSVSVETLSINQCMSHK